MNFSRRGLIGMLAAGAGAAIIRTPGLLMPIKPALIYDHARYQREFLYRTMRVAAERKAERIRLRTTPYALGADVLPEGEQRLFYGRVAELALPQNGNPFGDDSCIRFQSRVLA